MKYADINLKGRMSIADPVNIHTSKIKGVVLFLVFLILAGGLIYVFRDKITQSFNPISVVASVSGSKLKGTDGRTNVLLLGSDKRAKGEVISVLTDTILVASIGKVDNDVVLISVPRDLWAQSPGGYHSKINAVYTLAENDEVGKGLDELKRTLENVLGIPIHYYALITFDLFEQAVDILRGIDVKVDSSFTDYYYPVEGNEDSTCGKTGKGLELAFQQTPLVGFPCRYETVSFTAGQQTMTGKTALKFVRSRHGDNGEDTDFARSKRQQKVIAAIKDKSFSLQTLLDFNKVKNLYNAYAGNVDTNIDPATVESFYLLSKQIDLAKVVSIVLDDRSGANEGGLLYAPEDRTLYGNQYVLIPQTGDYSQIHAFVQKYLFGNK
jgi:anionic cell wall polymer biosynthesis LytR-Cps2A-Psr (LCP) family protein